MPQQRLADRPDLDLYRPAYVALGTYTVALALTDAGNLVSNYGEPNEPGALPRPGRPVQFTVTGS